MSDRELHGAVFTRTQAHAIAAYQPGRKVPDFGEAISPVTVGRVVAVVLVVLYLLAVAR